MTKLEPRSPRVAVIGDVGWAGLYHLGDEAMTEAAIGELQARDVTDITIIAAEAEPAAQRYRVDAIDRFGFGSRWGRKRLDDRYRALVAGINTGFAELPEDDPAHEIFALLQSCDAIVIAGGGNLTSRYLYHVYERSVLTKLADHLGTPLVMTSQTIGPTIDEDHRKIVAEILESATIVGGRETFTFELVNDLTGGRAHVYKSLDDAFHLQASPADTRRAAAFELDAPYAVASVSPYVSNPFWSEDAYFETMASICDAVATEIDATIYLIPHAGSPHSGEDKHDQVSHERVITASVSERIRSLPVMTATQCIAVMANAEVAVSTRYHPIVLGHIVEVPTISIGVDPYSFVRMYGAQKNFGTESLHLPARRATPEGVAALARQLVDQRATFAQHVKGITAIRSAEANTWWDHLVARINGSTHTTEPSFTEVATLELANVAPIARSEFDAYNELSSMYDSFRRERAARIRAEKDADIAKRDRDRLRVAMQRVKAESKALRAQLDATNSRKVVRLADRLGDVSRTLRGR
ncbi:polysaccharide pyruvyl transferase family protein [Paramicrobacterium chengjingii]|uniref:polysaccharide pyruvyl transferase family protein n=1 Tax=Paramicrobacterium chengjingii TaxID=2769067 RepID=UPI00141E6720|nr:polysaccharide pyruvyl transferase family protein [Microbacterium chengjingii]